MATLKAVVRGGRVVVEEKVDLPEGTELELAILDADGDDLDDEERAKLHASLDRAWAEYQAGRARPIEDFLKEL